MRFLWLIEACGDDPERLGELALLLAGASIAAGSLGAGAPDHVVDCRKAMDEVERRMHALLGVRPGH